MGFGVPILQWASDNATLDSERIVCEGERWGTWPSPYGLSLGLLAAFGGQFVAIFYHYLRVEWARTRGGATGLRIQTDAPRSYDLLGGLSRHVLTPGGAPMLILYLCGTWMLELLPCSYYSFSGGVRWWMVAAQIICQDAFMFGNHLVEHNLHAKFYQFSHKPHHRFTNPRLFDAFDGSVPDTFTMVLIPLYLTARLLHANVWEYMLFGTIWSSWLMLIHSEVTHPWDPIFRKLGLGTAADHHVHHKTFKYNFGHTMMWWDRLAGTYKCPSTVRAFNKSV